MMTDGFADHFGPANFPYGIATKSDGTITLSPQCVTRIDDHVVFLAPLADAGFFKGIEVPLGSIFRESTLNTFASLPKSVHRAVRSILVQVLGGDEKPFDFNDRWPANAVFPAVSVQMQLPIRVGDFTDFSVSMEHALTAGEIVTGKRALPPAFLRFPIGYGGRSSSIVVSGTDIERPIGQYLAGSSEDGSPHVIMAASNAVDYELEIAVVVGKPVAMRQRLRASDADEHIFGLVLLNDWSARDIQTFEMPPLGPMNGKNFGTTISPWIVTLDALDPFRVKGPTLQHVPASYLHDPTAETFHIDVQAEIISNGVSTITCRTPLHESLYWNFRQMLAHQTVGGCSLSTGDVLASGTVSGPGETQRGCLLETTRGGKVPLRLNDGTFRKYLEDNDIVRLSAMVGAGVGFGECTGRIVPSTPWEES